MDRKRREQEREAELGDLNQGLRVLAERLRLGELGEQQLTLAALLGHGDAQTLLAGQAPNPETIQELFKALDGYGLSCLSRAGLALAYLVKPDRHPRDLDSLSFFRLLHGLQCWIREPGDEYRDLLLSLEQTVRLDQQSAPLRCAYEASRLITEPEGAERSFFIAPGWLRESRLAELGWWTLQTLPGQVPYSPLTLQSPILRDALREALVPWALGEGDPVLDYALQSDDL